MTKRQFIFELRRGLTLDDHFEGTLKDALLRGDRLASRLGNISLYAYNKHINMWDPVGTFLGHMRFVNTWGDQYIIKSDYLGLVEAQKQRRKTK